MKRTIINLMYQAWDDLDHAIDGLTQEEATTRHGGGSSIAWTTGHLTTQIDSWFNMRLQGVAPHPVFDRHVFRTGGHGEAGNWEEIRTGMIEVRRSASSFLESETCPDLDFTVSYDGAIEALRENGLSLRYALLTVSAHHFHHVGEITTVRSLFLGWEANESRTWGAGFRSSGD